jgi:hypothetical protein
MRPATAIGTLATIATPCHTRLSFERDSMMADDDQVEQLDVASPA